MKRALYFSLLLLVLVTTAASFWLFHREGKPEPLAAKPPPNHVLLPEGAPQRAFLALDTAVAGPVPAAGPFNGRVTTADDATAKVLPPLNGRVLKVLVGLGDLVKKGTPLAYMDSPDYGSALADLHKAEADANLKDQVARRAEGLYAAAAIAKRELEAAQADAQAAHAELTRARMRVENLGADPARSEGERLVLRSPLDGVVVDRQANPGTEVRTDGTTPLFVVADPSRLVLVVDLPESEARVRVGDPVTFTVDAAGEERLSAKVERIAPVVDPVTRRISLRASVTSHNKALLPEMYARAELMEKGGPQGLRVPIGALLTLGLKTAVFVEAAPGDFERREVHLLRQDRDAAYLAVDGALHAGDRVVTKGALLLASELAGNE